MKKLFVLVLSGALFVCLLSAQTSEAPPDSEETDRVPEGFRNIRIGMGMDEVKDALQRDPYFAYRGDPDVSLIPASRQTLIECSGNGYVQRAYFQFHDRKLMIIILELDTLLVSYFDTFTALVEKYGNPSFLDPTQVVWRFTPVTLSLEKPLRVKYVDAPTFASLKEGGEAEEDLEILLRKAFLDQL